MSIGTFTHLNPFELDSLPSGVLHCNESLNDSTVELTRVDPSWSELSFGTFVHLNPLELNSLPSGVLQYSKNLT